MPTSGVAPSVLTSFNPVEFLLLYLTSGGDTRSAPAKILHLLYMSLLLQGWRRAGRGVGGGGRGVESIVPALFILFFSICIAV